MIAREDYVGPITKSAKAMFERAERQARREAGRSQTQRSLSPIRQAVHALGLTMTAVRLWEEAGAIVFERRGGQRLIDAAALERLSMVLQLRQAGLTVRQIAQISDNGPPSPDDMRRALQSRLAPRRPAPLRQAA